MESMQIQLGPEITACPSCLTELALEQSESESRKVKCPNCTSEFELDPVSISDFAQSVLQSGEMPLTFWDKLDFWYAPLLFLGIGIMLLFIDSPGLPLTVIPFTFVVLGLFHTYRAVVSHRITFVPNTDAIEAKIPLVRKLQERFKWSFLQAKNGSFLFLDRNGLEPREILLICTNEGFYFNCMVQASRAGSGVSILDTIKIIKAIKELTDPFYKPPLSYVDYCPQCAHYLNDQGVCRARGFNVARYPIHFVKKCNSKYFQQRGAA